jgi:hypothetical protein
MSVSQRPGHDTVDSVPDHGVFQGSWQGNISEDEFESEWTILKEDLAGFLNKAELIALKEHDRRTRNQGTRISYVPTFYAWGEVVK